MKKTVWKPTDSELEEMGFEKSERFGFYYLENIFSDTTLYCCTNQFSIQGSETDSIEIFPRSKEELQAFISMFEEDE